MEAFRREVVTVNTNIRGNLKLEVIVTEESSKGNELEDREVINIFEFFIFISKISIIIDKIFNPT